MRGALIAGLLAAIVDVTANVVSDNMDNPIAWLVFFVVVCISAIVGHLVEKSVLKKPNTTNIIGTENEVQQETKENSYQKANIVGKKNKVKQLIK